MNYYYFILVFRGVFDRQKYDVSLPDGWENILRNRPEMFKISKQPTNQEIIFAVPQTDAENKPAVSTMKTSPVSVSPPKRKQLNKIPPMQLPWDEPIWNVYIKYARSTVNIWGQWAESVELVSRQY